MAGMTNTPVLGLVENMAYFECPDCHQKHKIFGDSHIEQTGRTALLTLSKQSTA